MMHILFTEDKNEAILKSVKQSEFKSSEENEAYHDFLRDDYVLNNGKVGQSWLNVHLKMRQNVQILTVNHFKKHNGLRNSFVVIHQQEIDKKNVSSLLRSAKNVDEFEELIPPIPPPQPQRHSFALVRGMSVDQQSNRALRTSLDTVPMLNNAFSDLVRIQLHIIYK